MLAEQTLHFATQKVKVGFHLTTNYFIGCRDNKIIKIFRALKFLDSEGVPLGNYFFLSSLSCSPNSW